MVRRLSLAMFLAANIPFGAWALGLGDIHVRSALNQELSADIDLLSVKAGELDGLKVQLAAPEIFARAGVDRPYLLTQLRFATERREDGTAVIRVSTEAPIREPFLNFLIEVNWPKGRMVREYTLLLDPPVVTGRRPAPVVPPVAAAPATRPATMPATAEAPVTAVGGDYGPVRGSETLWAIAERLKPGDASVHQMMIALWRANPQAFVDQNINRLKAGATLRVPARDEVMAIAPQEALQEFRQQMTSWRGGVRQSTAAPAEAAVPPPVIERPPVEPASTAQPVAGLEAAVQPEAELRLLTPRPEGGGTAGPTEGETAAEPGTVTEIKEALLLAREANASLRQESEELRTRTALLEQQQADMQRLLTLANEQLARLQAGLTQDATEPAAERPGVAETASAEPTARPGTESGPQTAKAELPVPEAPVAAEKGTAPQTVEASAPAKAAPSPAGPLQQAENLLRSLLGDEGKLPIIGAAAGGLLLLLALLLRRRKTKIPEFVASGQPAARAQEQAAEPTHRARPGAAAASAVETSFLTDYTPSGVDTLHDDSGEVDAVAEADVYIAYGRYQQAEALIRQAIDRDPERVALKVKLLEIHFANKDQPAFVGLAEALAAAALDTGDPEAWKQVLAMGHELDPGHPLFAGAAQAAAAAPGSDELADDLDLEAMLDDDLKGLELADLAADFDEPAESAVPAADSRVDAEGALDLDLDFDLDQAMGGAERADVAPSSAPQDKPEDIGAELDLAAFEEALADHAEMAAAPADEAPDLGGAVEQPEAGQTLSDELAALDMEPAGEEPAVEGLDLGDLEQALQATVAEDLAFDLPTEDLAGKADAADELEALDDSLAGFSLDEFMDEQAAISQADFGTGEGVGEFDEAGTKLDLARAYIEMGEQDGARSILNEVLDEGSEVQKGEARELLEKLT